MFQMNFCVSTDQKEIVIFFLCLIAFVYLKLSLRCRLKSNVAISGSEQTMQLFAKHAPPTLTLNHFSTSAATGPVSSCPQPIRHQILGHKDKNSYQQIQMRRVPVVTFRCH